MTTRTIFTCIALFLLRPVTDQTFADTIVLDDLTDTTELLTIENRGQQEEMTSGVGPLSEIGTRSLSISSEFKSGSAQVVDGGATFSCGDSDFIGQLGFDYDGNVPFSILGDGEYVDVVSVTGDVSIGILVANVDENGDFVFAAVGFDIESPGIYAADFSEFSGTPIDYSMNRGFGVQVINQSELPATVVLDSYGLINTPIVFDLGDVDQDVVVNLLDIDPFVDLLNAGTIQFGADINGYGVVNLLDIQPFMAILGS